MASSLRGQREFVIHYDGFWMQIVPGRMKYLDYHGGSQFHLRLDEDELSYMGLIEDIHRSVGDDVPINGVNCICRGFLTTIYNDVAVLKMWDTIKAERDQKFHLFVTMVTPDMIPSTPTKAKSILNFEVRRSPRFSSQLSPINLASPPPCESESKLVSTQSPSTPIKTKSILNFEVRRLPRFSSQLSPINLASPPPCESESKLVSTQSPSTPIKAKSILNFEVRRSPRFSSKLSPINQASPVIQLSPCEDEDACEGIQVDEGIQQTAEDVVNDFAELFEIGEAFVDAVEKASAQEENNGEVQNDDSENEEGGRYFEKFQTGGPCVDMRCGYVSNQSTEYDDDDDFTPQDVEEDEVVCNLVNEATNLEEGADDVIDSLGLGTSNLYQGEPIPSVEDEDIKEDNKLKLEPSMQWNSMPECRSYLKSLAIQDIFSFKQKQNDTKRYRIYCIGEDHADKEMVKPCTWKADGKNHVKQAKAPWVAQVLEDFLRDHPSMKPLNVHKEVWRRFGVELSYYTAWKAKVKMFEKINGNYEASYLVVSELKKQIDIKNVGSLVKWYRHGETGEFIGFLLAYKASLDGFINGCRPIIGLDGSFLKGKYGGCCLSAMALDAQNGLFPIAIYICRGENGDTWKKILSQLRPYLIIHKEPLTFISDRQKGLIEAVDAVFPEAKHRYCFRHMYKNFKVNFKGELLRDLRWRAAEAFKECHHDRYMEQLLDVDEEAKEWLEGEAKHTWARSHFDFSTKCDAITNNFSESFNSWILKIRDKPLVQFVDQYSLAVMKLIHERRITSQELVDGDLVPAAMRVINKLENKYNKYKVQGFVEGFVEGVEHNSFCVINVKTEKKFVVDMTGLECTCVVWQMTGIPCVHAVCFIRKRRTQGSSWAYPFYNVQSFKATYAGFIYPFDNEEDWDKVEIGDEVLPPPLERKSGKA
ncbi:hypothetical protein IFM89_039414 [Coptis chinensis]|uniref:SWIM-type domain-containing protein n=1 Tax=Coptis chinensis TaxID=261450 RepID=A0A835IKK7_9MAGN|nr:hypothetical protein IFM89_039414 [Coptis chinensis]